MFETLDSAAAYRQLVAQVLRSSLPTVVSLDGGKLSSTGVVAGSGFKVVPVQQAAQCFGMAPDAPQVKGHSRCAPCHGRITPVRRQVCWTEPALHQSTWHLLVENLRTHTPTYL